MAGTIIKPESSCKHVGVTLCTTRFDEKMSCEKRIGAARSMLLAARGLGSASVRVPPTVLSKIYWAVAMPKMVYGMEVTDFDSSNIMMMETAHRVNAKIVQGLPMIIVMY